MMSFNSKYSNIKGVNPIQEFMCTNQLSNIKPFTKHWLNNAHLETLLPGSSWEKVYDLIVPELCERLLTQFSHENRKQALFELLGRYFVSKYFPQDYPDSTITRPPFLSSEESIKLYEEASKWLDITVERIIKEKGIYDRENEVVSEEMRNYIDQARNIFASHFKKELKKRESEYFKNISTFKPNYRLTESELHHKPETAISSVYDSDLPYTVQSISPYGPEMMIAPLPHCISFQSEFIGETLAGLCHNNEQQVQKISKVMSGRRLPISLRKFLWKNLLLQSQSPIYDKQINFEELIKEKFSRTVTRGISELKISHEIKSPVNDLLENLIIEHYEKSLPLSKFCNDVEYLSEAVKILNILYVYDRSYDPHLVFWLFPLHYGMKDDADSLPMNRIKFSYDTAMYLSLMSNVYPPWGDIFNIAEQVLHRLLNVDPEFGNHIFHIAQNNVLSQPKDFLVQIIDLERSKAKMKRLSQIKKDDSFSDIRGFEILKSPIIFIRKWIGEGFVSVLNSEGVLFIFDQLFMERFSPLVFEDACLAILLLLRNRFLLTKDNESMKIVFLEYPSSLFTVDIIRAWTWIHRGGDLTSVPNMNRREMYKNIPSEDLIPDPLEPLIMSPILLPYLCLNDIRLKLVFPAMDEEETKFANNINPEMLDVRASLSLCNSKLLELGTKSVPKLITIVQGINMVTNSYRFNLDEVIEFNNVDITHLVDIFNEGDPLYLLIKVLYRGTGNKEITFGWCLISCFIEEDHGIPQLTASQLLKPEKNSSNNVLKSYISKLKIKRFRHEIPLNCGDVSSTFIPLKSDKESGPILEGSMLSIYSYNGSSRPPTPPPETPKTQEYVEIPAPIVIIPNDVLPTDEFIPDIVAKEDPVEPQKNDNAWVPFNPTAYEKIKPRLSSKSEPFCLYIDQIRFLPDTATIIKVTGRFFQSNVDEQIPDILVIPDVESEPRSPKFRPSSRIVINKERRLNLNVNSLLVLRVYTVLRTNLEIAVIGNVIVPIFDQNEGLLLSGCFQKRLRNQMPKMGLMNTSGITKDSLDGAPYIDCVSITYRLWPYTENNIVSPEYEMGFYESSDCQPTKFEWNIFGLYKSDTFLSKDLREVVKDIKYRDANPEFKDQAVTHVFMINYLPNRLDISKSLDKDKAPEHIATELMFHYRIEKGINIKVYAVYGLAEDKLLFVTTKVLRGEKTASTPERSSLGYGKDEFKIFSNLDPNSSMRACKWRDSFQLIKPYYDEKALLVVQVWGINAVIKEGQFYDKITDKPIIKLNREYLVGWTAIPLFKHGFVCTGKHQLPLFNNRIHHSLLKRFQSLSVSTVIKAEEEFQSVNPSSIIVYLFDAHKGIDEYPAEQPVITEILESTASGKTPYITAMTQIDKGKTVFEEVNEIVPDTELTGKNNETKTSVFKTYFEDLAKKLPSTIPAKQPFQPIFF